MVVPVNVTIDGQPAIVEQGKTILDAMRMLNLTVPTLCFDPYLNPVGSCRACMVEVEGSRVLQPACSRVAEEGMKVLTDSKRAKHSRRIVLELLLADHRVPCDAALKPAGCELEKYATEYGLLTSRFPKTSLDLDIDDSNQGIIFNPAACIMCTQCIRACDDLQVNEVIGQTGRGFGTKISFDFDDPMGKSSCVSCGECVAYCPTGALVEKSASWKLRTEDIQTIPSICPYCGVGCSVDYHVSNGNILKAVGAKTGPANKGKLCVKGRFGYDYTTHKERLTVPLIRKPGIPRGPIEAADKLSAFREASWDEALDYVARKFNELKAEYGSDALSGLSSAKCPNEENYVFQKFIRAVFRTNNVDYCTRLCHSSSVYALVEALGEGASTNSIDDIGDSDVIMVLGSNTTETHPVIATFIKQAVKKGTKLIVVDTRRTDLVKHAHIFLQLRPGTDVALLNGLAHIIISEGLHDKNFIAKRTENFNSIVKAIEPYHPEMVEKITGVRKQQLREAARLYATARSAAIYWGMGISQHTTGSDNSFALINLALMTGQVGKLGSGLNPLRGQNNVQGASDVGALPFAYPGYLPVENQTNREKFEGAWGVKLSPKRGLTVTEMMKAAHAAKLKGIYIMGENPALSDPNINKVDECLRNFEFMVVQDIFLTETAEYADVVLPAATVLEKDGTYVNTDRRVQLGRKIIDPPGQARPDWQIVCDIAERMGYPMKYSSTAEIAEEIAKVTPIFGGITHDRLKEKGIQWPCPNKDHPGTAILHTEKFTRGLAKFTPVAFMPAKELPDGEYPFVLNTGRYLEHWHTGTMTRRAKVLDSTAPEAHVEMAPADMRKLGIRNLQTVKVSSRRGEVTLKARASGKMTPGTIFIPFHFKEAAANLLTIDAVDPYAKIPEFKFCAVKIEPT